MASIAVDRHSEHRSGDRRRFHPLRARRQIPGRSAPTGHHHQRAGVLVQVRHGLGAQAVAASQGGGGRGVGPDAVLPRRRRLGSERRNRWLGQPVAGDGLRVDGGLHGVGELQQPLGLLEQAPGFLLELFTHRAAADRPQGPCLSRDQARSWLGSRGSTLSRWGLSHTEYVPQRAARCPAALDCPPG